MTGYNTLTKILAFAVLAEAGTGLILLFDPSIFSLGMMGASISSGGALFGRMFGVSLLGLGLACWPSSANMSTDSPAFRAMLFYNAAIALLIAYFGLSTSSGALLWPAVGFHIVVSLLLFNCWRSRAQSQSH